MVQVILVIARHFNDRTISNELHRWLSGDRICPQCRRCKRCRFDPRVGKIPLEEGMATHSSILAWRIPWREEPGRLQSIGLQGVGHNWACTHHITYKVICKYLPREIISRTSWAYFIGINIVQMLFFYLSHHYRKWKSRCISVEIQWLAIRLHLKLSWVQRTGKTEGKCFQSSPSLRSVHHLLALWRK